MFKCNNSFTQNFNLNKHLNERRCKGDLVRFNNLLNNIKDRTILVNSCTQTKTNSYAF